MMNSYSYFKAGSCWHRSPSLDQECAQQRSLDLWKKNPNYHGRKEGVIETFLFHVNKGKSRDEAYKLACTTQLLGIAQKKMLLNVDSKTTWAMEAVDRSK